jgi:predicted Fe-Mo cluster-binding NifX family protein
MFAILEVDPEEKKILKTEYIPAPPHQRGFLPRRLRDRGVKVIIANGMSRRALLFFTDHGIGVVVGVLADRPEAIARAYLAGVIQAGENIRDHRHTYSR